MRVNVSAVKVRLKSWFMRPVALLVLIGISGCATVAHQYEGWSEYRKGLDLFKAERYDEAREHVKVSLELVPERPEFLALLGWIHYRQSRIDEAGRLFARVYEADRTSVFAFQGLAWVDYATAKLDSSEKWFSRELGWATDHMEKPEWVYYSPADVDYISSIRSDAAYGLGLVALARGAKGAEEFLKQALAHPNSFIGHGPIFKALGDLYFTRKDYAKARLHYEKALALEEDAGTAAKGAWCLYHLGDRGGADRVFSRLLSSSTDRRPALYGLVFTRHGLGRTGEAEAHLKELIGLDPYFPDTTELHDLIARNQEWRLLWRDFAQAYLERGDFARASVKVEGYLPLAGQDCSARLIRSWCALQLQGPQAGLSEFTKLSDQRLCPGDQVATGRGVALLYLNRLDEARREFQKAGRENPGNDRAAVALGAVAFLKGSHEEAIGIYTRNLSRLPKEENYFSWPSHALNNLGWSYIKTKRYQEAYRTFLQLRTMHRKPLYPEIFDGLGWSLFHLNRFQESKAAFEQALQVAPGYASSLAGLTSVGRRQR